MTNRPPVRDSKSTGSLNAKVYTVTFEKSMTVSVAAPADMSDEDFRLLAEAVGREGLDDWDPPDDWTTYVGRSQEVDVADEDRLTCQIGYRTHCKPNPIRRAGTAVSDGRDDIVASTDADWWQVKASRFNGPEAEGVAAQVSIQFHRDRTLVPGFVFEAAPGLAVNKGHLGRWQVSHTPSGAMVCECVDRAEAFRAITHLGASGVDWTQSLEVLAGTDAVHRATQGSIPAWVEAS